jgi:glycosyltransferase involved in cell wall biosynthesis
MTHNSVLVAIQVQNYSSAAAHFHRNLCSKVCGSESVRYLNKSVLLPIHTVIYIINRLRQGTDKSPEISVLCDFGLLQALLCILLIRLFTSVDQVSFFTTYYHHVIPLRIILRSSFRLNEAYKLFSCILFRFFIKILPTLSGHFFVVTVSPNSKSYISKYTGLSSLYVYSLYNPQFSSFSSSLCELVNDLPIKTNKYLVVSSLESRKNPSFVFNILNQYPSMIKIVVPKKKITHRLRKYAPVSDCIYSDISPSDLISLYRSSVYVVVPSFFEGLSLVPLEAISNAALVVLSDIPVHRLLGLPDIQYFDPNSYESLSITLSNLDKMSYPSLLRSQAEAFSISIPAIQQSMNSEIDRFLQSFYHES